MMQKSLLFILGIVCSFILVGFIPKIKTDLRGIKDPTIIDIVNSYKRNLSEWPKPFIDKGVAWEEFAPLERDPDLIKKTKKNL